MPYSKDKPPDRIKGLPEHAQDIWISAFNAALAKYKEEDRANKIAWGAVKNAGYEQDKDGKWHKAAESVTEAIARLRPVDPEQFSVYEVRESAVLLKDAKEQIGILPYVESSGAYSFGQFRYPPILFDDPIWQTVKESEPVIERTSETFTAKESETIAFTASEGVTIGGETYHAKPDVGEYPVFVVAEGVNRPKKRAYTAKALEGVSENFYAGCPMHLDHAGKEGELPPRSVKDVCGKVLKSGRAVVHEGVKKIPAYVKFVDAWTREHMADADWRSMVGLSHVADVAGYVGQIGKDTVRVIESIVRPYAVDVVSTPAFGGKVMESAGVDRRMEDLDMLETLKIEDLTTHRPDLVTAIKESARVGFRVQEEESTAVATERARADAAEAKEKATRLDLYKVRVREATTTAVTSADLKVPEAARTLIVDRVTARLGEAEVSADKLSETVQNAVKEEIKLGQTFVPGKPLPKVKPNLAAGTEGIHVTLQQRFDRMLHVEDEKDPDAQD